MFNINHKRSPKSNQYFPTTESESYPSDDLRKLELKLNVAFNQYANLYYSGSAVCSVYLWDLEESITAGFAGAIVIKNSRIQ
jgi:hypothetical protein